MVMSGSPVVCRNARSTSFPAPWPTICLPASRPTPGSPARAETSAMAGRAHDTGDQAGFVVMENAGNEIATLSEEVTVQIVALGDEVTQDWIAEMAERGLDGAQLVEDARAAVEATRGAATGTDG